MRQLAEALGRCHKNVHADVGTLLATGVLDRDDLGGLSAGYDAIAVEIAIAF